jgi:hypothetical protein
VRLLLPMGDGLMYLSLSFSIPNRKMVNYQQSRKRPVIKRYQVGRTPAYTGPVRVYPKALTMNVGVVSDTTGGVQLLNGIALGTALDQRLGREVRCGLLRGNLLSYVTAATGVDQIHRILLVWDKQPNGAALAILDVLDATTVYAQQNIANTSRFKILWDVFHALNASAEPGSLKAIEVSIPIKKVAIYNSGGAGTVADIATGSLYLISLGNIAPGATAGGVAGTLRLTFSTDV